MTTFIYLKTPHAGSVYKYEVVAKPESSWLVRSNPGDRLMYLSHLYDNGYRFVKIIEDDKW